MLVLTSQSSGETPSPRERERSSVWQYRNIVRDIGGCTVAPRGTTEERQLSRSLSQSPRDNIKKKPQEKQATERKAEPLEKKKDWLRTENQSVLPSTPVLRVGQYVPRDRLLLCSCASGSAQVTHTRS